jgi:hypothetical protein
VSPTPIELGQRIVRGQVHPRECDAVLLAVRRRQVIEALRVRRDHHGHVLSGVFAESEHAHDIAIDYMQSTLHRPRSLRLIEYSVLREERMMECEHGEVADVSLHSSKPCEGASEGASAVVDDSGVEASLVNDLAHTDAGEMYSRLGCRNTRSRCVSSRPH